MNMPTIEELRTFGEVLITWGFWFIVYGAIAIIIGLTIVTMCNKQIVKFFG
ncbi:hypothetical protein NE172_02200 [Clostridium botulinum]|uniref:hypothetical protein n=1 Tax=Clostridium botulinum TaxID=1491 RepID=UPI0001AADC5D|nr:hypothetical protein [Clostridium botulinum]EES47831.1 hypothetical protein CLO_0568 [Clostridium botulinum E1 str. 'BoNT E Beluga']MBY6759757.1 hypothetical protein [Clostridium botulinum]MBY6918666.1 hypothetical protein [Clostridium botulinum]MBY6988608.1 hypothetical protein [Clostridium botulinum]MCR1129752.1 hypothetical protein [Clostridium botulinum]